MIIQLKWEMDEKIKIFLKSFKLKIVTTLIITDKILIKKVIFLFIWDKINKGISFWMVRIIMNELYSKVSLININQEWKGIIANLIIKAILINVSLIIEKFIIVIEEAIKNIIEENDWIIKYVIILLQFSILFSFKIGINIIMFISIISQKINQLLEEIEIIIVNIIIHFIKFLKKINKGINHFWGMNPLAFLAYFILKS